MKHQDGFTLIEILVSFVILSGAIILSFESYTGGLLNLHQAQAALDAQTLAQSAMTRVLGDDPALRPGANGTAGRFSWQVTVRPLPAAHAGAMIPMLVEVRVFDQHHHEIVPATLSTIFIVKPPAP